MITRFESLLFRLFCVYSSSSFSFIVASSSLSRLYIYSTAQIQPYLWRTTFTYSPPFIIIHFVVVIIDQLFFLRDCPLSVPSFLACPSSLSPLRLPLLLLFLTHPPEFPFYCGGSDRTTSPKCTFPQRFAQHPFPLRSRNIHHVATTTAACEFGL